MPPVDGNGSRREPAAVLVIGGGIGGMRSALDLAEAGLKVYLVEQTPCLGGRVAKLGFMFPQHDCVLCRGTSDHGYGCTRPSISPAYIHNNQHPNIEILTLTHVIGVEGQAGNFSVLLRQEPRYVNPSRCTNCGYCAEVCPIELPNQYQQGITTRKAAYKVAARAAPDAYVIERGSYCNDCNKCVEVCTPKAIDLNEQPRLLVVNCGAIILALGFQDFDASGLEELGYARYPNVLNAMEYERLASRSGPTEGIILRPSNQRPPRSIAWLQCIGSRDANIQYCSSICCMYATKEAMLAKQRLGDEVACRIFIMDERAFNKEYHTYFEKARRQHGVQYSHCRVSSVREDPATQNLLIQYADPNGVMHQESFELVVLATGVQPPASAGELSQLLNIDLNEYGFCLTDKFSPLQTSRPGVFVCGAFSSPKEIVETIIDASGAAAEAMRLMNDRLNTYDYSREWPFLSGNGLPPEKDVSSEPVRVGVYTCECGGAISEIIDLPALNEQARQWPGVPSVEHVKFACFPSTLEAMQKKINTNEINRVVVAACSNRTHDSLFQKAVRQAGLNPYMVELVNIREQCARVHRWQPELANRKAAEMVRIAVGRASKATSVQKETHRSRSAALVIGGGVSGMTAALAIADSGYHVHLVERTEMLGGNLLNLFYVAEGYNPQRLLRDLVNRIRSHQRITVYPRTELVRHTGHVGFFQSHLRSQLPEAQAAETVVEHSVTIVATGGREARDHRWLAIPGVITQRELEDKIIHHPDEIAKLTNLVIVQCVSPDGVLDYCSRVCCTNTMKNAIRVKLFNPNCQVTVLYKNIVTYGFREAFYTDARQHGVIFVRYNDAEPPVITQKADMLQVAVRDPSLGRMLHLPADMVTLSMPVLPSIGTETLAQILEVPLSSEGFFQEAQLKLRPMDFMRDGIFLAGMAHYPKFIEESISHALAAAARALTIIPRNSLHLGGVVAQVDPQKCVGCLTCTRTCPFQIPRVIQAEDRQGVGSLGGAAFIDPAQCQGCGTCTGECPANAIQLVNYTDEQILLREIAGLGRWQPEGV